MATKKDLQNLLDKYHDRNETLQAEVECLKREIKQLKENFVKNYNYVILNKDCKTEIYKDGIELKRVYSINIEQDAGNLPSITMEMC